MVWTQLTGLQVQISGQAAFETGNRCTVLSRSLTEFRQRLRGGPEYADNVVTNQNLTLQFGTAATRATVDGTSCNRRSSCGNCAEGRDLLSKVLANKQGCNPALKVSLPHLWYSDVGAQYLDEMHGEETKPSKRPSSNPSKGVLNHHV